MDSTVCADIWKKLDAPLQAKPIHLLLALNFLKNYNTEYVASAQFSMDEKTYRKRLWKMLIRLSSMRTVRKIL